MALGGGLQRLRSGVNHGGGTAGEPCGKRHTGLHRQIELGAEAAAAGRGDDADLLRRKAHDQRRVITVHVGRLRRGGDFDAVADAARPSGLGLNIGVLDEGGFELALDDDGIGGERCFDVARFHMAAHQDVAGPRLLQLRCERVKRCGDGEDGRALLPRYGEGLEFQRIDGGALAHHGGHGLAAEARLAFGEDRLVGEGRDDAEEVAPGDIRRGQHAQDARVGADEGVDVANVESSPVVWRADGPHPQGIGRNGIGAEGFRSGHLRCAIEPGDAGADGVTRTRRRRVVNGAGSGIGHGSDDLGIAGAAAKHTAEAILDVTARRARAARQQRHGGDQHARRADAALRRAMRQESLLQQ